MKRLTTLDKWLVLILAPLYVVCFALGLKGQITDTRAISVGLSVSNKESAGVRHDLIDLLRGRRGQVQQVN